MKKLLFIITLILMPFCMFGQKSNHKNPLPLAKFDDNVKMPLTAKERAQIIEVYGESAEKLVFSNPNRLKNIKHILRNRVVIELITDENLKKPCPKLSEMAEAVGLDYSQEGDFNPKDFNPLKYGLNFYSRAAAMYHVDNTDYYIIIKSQYQ